jgi:hypothetical protein
MNDDYDEGPRARAITWEEWRRGGGSGGPGGPDREPTWLGRKFREWASNIINRERDSLDKPAQTPAEYVAAQKKNRELTDKFNRINQEGVEATIEAVTTLFKYKFGFSQPAPQQT